MKPLIIYANGQWHCAVCDGRTVCGARIVRHPIGCGYTARQAYDEWKAMSQTY